MQQKQHISRSTIAAYKKGKQVTGEVAVHNC